MGRQHRGRAHGRRVDPGHTRVLFTTIFEYVEIGKYVHTHVVSAFMLIFSFLVLLTVYIANRRFPIHAS